MKSDPLWDAFRQQMPVANRWAYFDHAAVAPLPEPVSLAMNAWVDSATADGVASGSRWRKIIETARRRAATLLNARPEEIALVHNTTEGINLVAEGVPWRAGENVVTLESEFPSNLYPWMNLKDRGVETRLVPADNERVDLDQVAAACDSKTRILSVSWVGFATGWRNDLAALADIAHRAGAKLFVDAIQGLGAFPLDVTQIPVDFLAADGHKWLLGPEGAGVLYVRQEHLDWLRPLGIGWNSVLQAGDFADTRLRLKQTAGRYEGGTYHVAGMVGLAAALEWLLSFGVERLSERLLEVTEHLIEELTTLGATIASDQRAAHRSGIVACTWPGVDPLHVKRLAFDQGVILNCRNGRLRLSPHVYTNAEDVQRLKAALQSCQPE